MDEKRIVIVRCYSAGVFYGTLESANDNQRVVLTNARRLWQWAGAASLSQLAMEGVKDPANCKFATPVNRIELFQTIEIIDTTEEARISIEGVPVWRAL